MMPNDTWTSGHDPFIAVANSPHKKYMILTYLYSDVYAKLLTFSQKDWLSEE